MSTEAVEQVRRPDPLTDRYEIGETVWTIEAHDDQPIAEGKKYAADFRVLLLVNGERIREFTYPAYRIWTLLAHWTEGLGDLEAEYRASQPASSEREGQR